MEVNCFSFLNIPHNITDRGMTYYFQVSHPTPGLQTVPSNTTAQNTFHYSLSKEVTPYQGNEYEGISNSNRPIGYCIAVWLCYGS